MSQNKKIAASAIIKLALLSLCLFGLHGLLLGDLGDDAFFLVGGVDDIHVRKGVVESDREVQTRLRVVDRAEMHLGL